MAGECGVILKVVEPMKSFVFGAVSEYVGYIGSCEDNLSALQKCLSEVCDKKDDIMKKVKEGNDRQEEITREAASWLKDVRILMVDEELKGLMYKDIQTAKFVVKIMGKRDLKRRINEEGEMQELVVKVIKKLKKEMDESEEEMRKIVEVDYKQVAEVVVDMMKDTIDEFKKLMKEDKEMAVIATRTLMDRDLDKLTKGDREMEEIVREAGKASDEEFCQNRKDEESDALLVKIPTVGLGKNRVKEAASKLFTPLTNLVTPLGKLMDDANFKKVMPEAEGVKLGLEVIDGLLIRGRGLKKEVDDSTKQHRGCCFSSLSFRSDFHARYLISKAAEHMTKYIQDEFISKCPRDPVTLHIRTVDLKPIPTNFLKGLDSRTQLLHQILEKLNDDEVNSIGLFGMGGTGKTTLAKEVSKRVTKDAFAIKVMVEVSDAPDFIRIQAAIAESIDLPLHDVDNVAQRAIRIYNRLISEKEKKILVILDNVWKKLNLDEIGIPHTCTFLITTRDRDVCRIMDVRDVNILEMGVLSTIEARELFKSQTGIQVDAKEYKNVVERLLSKCGGLPLAIVATTNSLKDKDLSSWEKFANDLEKPISSQISGDYRHTFSILNTSYKFIQDEKRIFFLLACLSPLGSSASIESLMRYGMGLNLFEHVNKLSEAMEQAATWANELMLSSMLLEGDVKGDVKIHDIVRTFAISYAAKEEEHKFMVESIPRWLDNETLKKYTAMSLTSKNDYSRLSGVEVCKLQILILKGELLPNFDDFFFNGMVNLKVLALSNMNFLPSLPESMRKLKNLRTLCLEGCKLGNIELVGELVNLLVLSLRKSFVEKLPNEVGNLCKLRLLDLSDCISNKLPLIPTEILCKLSTLEGLYMFNNTQSVLETESDYEEAIATTEINRLPYLNALEIKVAAIEELPFDDHLMGNVDKFKICVGNRDFTEERIQKFGCSLNLKDINARSVCFQKSCLKVLLKKADYLEMWGCNNFEDLVPQLDKEGFRSLRSLILSWYDGIKCIVDGQAMDNLIVFPCLESLNLSGLRSLEMVCNGDISPGTFSNLQAMTLHHLDKLLYGLPLVPTNVNKIVVSACELLKFVFIVDEALATELPFLQKLQLTDVPSLLSLLGPKTFSNTYDALQGPQILFDGKIELPSLEYLLLSRCHNIVMLWSKQIYAPPGFQNLKSIKIIHCRKLSSLGSPSVFSILGQLETLSIRECLEMHEVISVEETEESEIGERVIKFPQLKFLELKTLSNLEMFYGGGFKLEFSKLKTLELDMLGSMKRFAKFENSSALFNEKIEFPCLEELRVIYVNDEVIGLWDKQLLSVATNPAPMLTQLALGSSTRLRQIPSIVLENLSSLALSHFQDDALFSSSDLGEKEGFVWIYSQLPNLEELRVEGSHTLKELFRKEDCNAMDHALTLFCGQIKTVDLKCLPSLSLIPLPLFKNVTSLTLFEITWSYLISAHALEDSLHQLQFISIERCYNMEALVINVGSHIKLPRLKKLRLCRLASFIGISSTPVKEAALLFPSLETLEVEDCNKLERFWTGSILAPRLEYVDLSKCANLQQFLVGNLEDTIELPSLQKVILSSCRFIKSISSGSLTAPKLREVHLWKCNTMECFFPGNPNHDGDLQLPSLEIVYIANCPNLRAFSLRPVLAPKVTQITYERTDYSMLPFDNLNHFLQKINPTN